MTAVSEFHYLNHVLHAESVAIPDIVSRVGTPVYVYSRSHFESQFQRLEHAMGGMNSQIFYAVKANSNLDVLRCFNKLGAGFDIVSGGELQRVLAAGAAPERVVFSGVGKSTEELDLALKLGIGCFNVESQPELRRLADRAALLERHARISVRVNPNVDAATHPYISTGLKENKFGVQPDQALAMYRWAASDPWLEPAGVACHIGSQILEQEPMLEALQSLLQLVDELASLESGAIVLQHVDLGGGFGVTYEQEAEFDVESYGRSVAAAIGDRDIRVSIEPGRFLVANAGILVTTVEYLKPGKSEQDHHFAVVDAAMNDLIRPALYQAWHRVANVSDACNEPELNWDIVGPVCESADFLAKNRSMRIADGDLLAVFSAGAYCMVQSSNYNSRPRPVEVLVEADTFRVIRRRETTEDLMRCENL